MQSAVDCTGRQLADEPLVLSGSSDESEEREREIAERMRGFRQAVVTLGLESHRGLVRQGLHDAAVAQEQALSMLGDRNPPTALFAGKNLITADPS